MLSNLLCAQSASPTDSHSQIRHGERQSNARVVAIAVEQCDTVTGQTTGLMLQDVAFLHYEEPISG